MRQAPPQRRRAGRPVPSAVPARRAREAPDAAARAVVDPSAIEANARAVAAAVAPARLFAVVKADGYGHGIAVAARACLAGGASALCVATTAEAEALRRAAPFATILLLNPVLPVEAPRLLKVSAVPAVSDLSFAAALARAAPPAGSPVHVNVNTGIGRDGLTAGELSRLTRDPRFSRLRVTGAMTHFVSGDGARDGMTLRQLARFHAALAAASGRSRRGALTLHAANSATILTARAAWLDAVRPGLLLYGVSPLRGGAGRSLAVRLRPALTLSGRVVAVRTIAAGDTVGYGPAYVARRRVRIATIAVGYADGVPGSAAGRAEVLLRGRRARMIGSVNMDGVTVDATAIPGVAVGDEALLIGRRGRHEITLSELARRAGANPREILCGVGPRVVRVVSG